MFKILKYELNINIKTFLLYGFVFYLLCNLSYYLMFAEIGFYNQIQNFNIFFSLGIIGISLLILLSILYLFYLFISSIVGDFIDTLYSDKAYFLFLSPQKNSNILYAKILRTFIFFNIILFSGYIFVYTASFYEFSSINLIPRYIGKDFLSFMIKLIYREIIIFSNISLVYFSITLLKAKFPRNKKKANLWLGIFLIIRFLIGMIFSILNIFIFRINDMGSLILFTTLLELLLYFILVYITAFMFDKKIEF